MPLDLDANRKYDADFWRGVLERREHLDGSKLVLLVAKQKIDQWCALEGGLTLSELRALLEEVKTVIRQGRERQGAVRRRPPERHRRARLRLIK